MYPIARDKYRQWPLKNKQQLEYALVELYMLNFLYKPAVLKHNCFLRMLFPAIVYPSTVTVHIRPGQQSR